MPVFFQFGRSAKVDREAQKMMIDLRDIQSRAVNGATIEVGGQTRIPTSYLFVTKTQGYTLAYITQDQVNPQIIKDVDWSSSHINLKVDPANCSLIFPIYKDKPITVTSQCFASGKVTFRIFNPAGDTAGVTFNLVTDVIDFTANP
jgi:hypothetical protein